MSKVESYEAESYHLVCPCCDGEGAYMGSLGDSSWFRCRHCGMEYTESGYRSQGTVELTVAEEDA